MHFILCIPFISLHRIDLGCTAQRSISPAGSPPPSCLRACIGRLPTRTCPCVRAVSGSGSCSKCLGACVQHSATTPPIVTANVSVATLDNLQSCGPATALDTRIIVRRETGGHAATTRSRRMRPTSVAMKSLTENNAGIGGPDGSDSQLVWKVEGIRCVRYSHAMQSILASTLISEHRTTQLNVIYHPASTLDPHVQTPSIARHRRRAQHCSQTRTRTRGPARADTRLVAETRRRAAAPRVLAAPARRQLDVYRVYIRVRAPRTCPERGVVDEGGKARGQGARCRPARR